jgi:hypothetical protein
MPEHVQVKILGLAASEKSWKIVDRLVALRQ